ncbi:metallophosphoesterase [Pradoshia sp.]
MVVKMVLMIILAVLIYGAISFYIWWNGKAWLSVSPLRRFKRTYTFLFLLLSLSMFIGMIPHLGIFKWIGGYWYIIIGYSLILLPLFNLAYYLLKKKGLMIMGILYFLFFAGVIAYGSYQAFSPVVRYDQVEVEKEAGRESLKILMASDTHLGPIVRSGHLEKLVRIVEEEKPDIVLIPGDIIDDQIDTFNEENMIEIFGEMEPPLGVYMSPGNHDYYGDDLNELKEELEDGGIRLLMDETEEIDGLYLVGRKDMTDDKRASISELVEGLDDQSKPIIMLDHTPMELTQAEESGVDIILSGHTHRGQVFPGNLVTDWIYENDWGHLKKGNLHSFVSSGFGTWGPPLRIGSRSEVWVIDVNFN